MASTKKPNSVDRHVKHAAKGDLRAVNKEKVRRESSRSRTSEPNREVINKGRSDKIENEPQKKHRSSSRETSRQAAASIPKEKSKELDVRRTHARTAREIIETKLGKDHNANAKAKGTDRKTVSKKNEVKESHSKSRSTHGETGNSMHKTSIRSSRDMQITKSSAKDIDEIQRKGQVKAASYAITDNEVQSDVEEDYPDDFENYESDFESSFGQEEEIEEKEIPPKVINSPVKPQLSEPLKPSALKNVDIKISDGVKEAGISPNTFQKVNKETIQQNRIKEQPKENNDSSKINLLTEDDELPSANKKSHSFINFNAAKHKLKTQKTISKIKTRGDILLDLITLDETSINLFSMAPAAYDEFMVTFGSTNTRQAYIQTGEDNIPETSQTDPVEMLDLWTQFPPFIGGAAGGEFISKRNKHVEVKGIKDWKRLNQFLHMASRTMCNILEEDQMVLNDNTHRSTKENYEFSDRMLHMKPPLHMQEGCKISQITSSKLQPHILLAICEEKTVKLDNQSHNNTIICVWNVYQPSIPQKLLICKYANPLSCCLDDQANFAFVGMDDCTIALWDLREPDGFHSRKAYDDTQSISFRTPTYSTAGMWAPEGHHGAVVAMSCRQDSYSATNVLSHKALAGDQNPHGIIQLATLEEPANIFIWVVSELSQPPVEYEPGLSPNGRVKLIKSSVINLQELPNAQQYLKTYPRAFDFINDPIDASMFYIATDMGVIISCSLHRGKCKVYGQALDISTEATSLCFLPMGRPSYFLAGYNDGSVILYGSKKEKALMSFRAPDNTTGVVKVQWSSSSPNIFYVLHKDGRIYIWDLNSNDSKQSAVIASNQKRITSFDVGNDKRLQNSSAANYQPQITIGYDDCTMEAHYLSSRYSRNGPEEMQHFEKFVEFL